MNALLSAFHPTKDWADLAARHGYHDQSHLIHDFQLMIGGAPEKSVRTLATPQLLGGAIVVPRERALRPSRVELAQTDDPGTVP